jgi:hypothetical protein
MTCVVIRRAAQSDQESAYSHLQTTDAAKLKLLRPQFATLVAQDKAATAQFNADLANSNGLMKSLQALAELADHHPIIAEARMWLELLFIFIEIMPVLTKAMMNVFSKFAYDDVLEARDDVIRRAAQAKATVESERIEADAAFARSTHTDLLKRQQGTVRMVNDEVISVQRELISENLQAWKAQARATTTSHTAGTPSNGQARPGWHTAAPATPAHHAAIGTAVPWA